MSSSKYTELLSREQKEEYAKKRMREMKLKNEKILQRHAEVEIDRMAAESQNSAVTSGKVSSASYFQRGRIVMNENKHKEEKKNEYAREWDRGKPPNDEWIEPEPARWTYRNFRGSGRYERKEREKYDCRNNYSRKDSMEFSHDRRSKGEFKIDEQLNRGGWQNPPLKAPYKTFYKTNVQGDPVDDWNVDKTMIYKGYSKNEGKEYSSDNRKAQDNWRSKPSDRNQYHVQVSPRRMRGEYDMKSHRKYHSNYLDDKFKKHDFKQSNSKKKYSHKTHSRSSSKSESDDMENHFTSRTFNLWQNDKSQEDKTKQTRVETWVKSVHKTNMAESSTKKQESSTKSFTKFDRIEICEESDEEDMNSNTAGGIKMESKKFSSPLHNYKQNSSLPSPNSKCVRKTELSDNKQNSGQNTGYSSNCEFVKKTLGHYKKGFQTKHNLPFKGRSSVNEYTSKQTKNNRYHKSDDAKNMDKFEPNCNSPVLGKAKSPRNDVLMVNKTSIEVDQKNYKIVDEWDKDESLADGLWGEAQQSNIKWDLSDEETKPQEPNRDSEEEERSVYPDDSLNIFKATKESDGKISEKDIVENKAKDSLEECEQKTLRMRKNSLLRMTNHELSVADDKSSEIVAEDKLDKGDGEILEKDIVAISKKKNSLEECEEKTLRLKNNSMLRMMIHGPKIENDESSEMVAGDKSDNDDLNTIKVDCETAVLSGSTDIQQKELLKGDIDPDAPDAFDVMEIDCETAVSSGSTNIQQKQLLKGLDPDASDALDMNKVDCKTAVSSSSANIQQKKSLREDIDPDAVKNSQVCSDDGGWSTVSEEEGEVQ